MLPKVLQHDLPDQSFIANINVLGRAAFLQVKLHCLHSPLALKSTDATAHIHPTAHILSTKHKVTLQH